MQPGKDTMELEIQNMAIWEQQSKGWKVSILLTFKAMEVLEVLQNLGTRTGKL